MNKTHYRLVFNKLRGMLMAVPIASQVLLTLTPQQLRVHSQPLGM